MELIKKQKKDDEQEGNCESVPRKNLHEVNVLRLEVFMTCVCNESGENKRYLKRVRGGVD